MTMRALRTAFLIAAAVLLFFVGLAVGLQVSIPLGIAVWVVAGAMLVTAGITMLG